MQGNKVYLQWSTFSFKKENRLSMFAPKAHNFDHSTYFHLILNIWQFLKCLSLVNYFQYTADFEDLFIESNKCLVFVIYVSPSVLHIGFTNWPVLTFPFVNTAEDIIIFNIILLRLVVSSMKKVDQKKDNL